MSSVGANLKPIQDEITALDAALSADIAAAGVGFHPAAKWQEVTRAANTDFVNNTQFSIAVSCRAAIILVTAPGGLAVSQDNGVSGTQYSVSSSVIVPVGHTYKLAGTTWFGNVREFREPI